MRIAVGSDEATALTEEITEALRTAGHELDLLGSLSGDDREWAAVSAETGRRVSGGACETAVLFCWSGTGAAIAANKVPGVRAALCGDPETARLARKYNHANVLVMSLRATSPAVGREITEAFLDEPLGADDFDRRNVAHVDALDADGRS